MTRVLTKNVTKDITKSMKKILSNTSIRAIAFSFLFLISGIGASLLINPASATPSLAAPSAVAPVAAAATPLSAAQANWLYSDGNQFGQDYSPQTQINASNAKYLGMNWIWPVPSVPTTLQTAVQFSAANIDTSPIIYDGTLYVVTVFGSVTALNAQNGDELWTDVLPINANSTQGLGIGSLILHLHQGVEAFTDSSALFGGTPTYWIALPNEAIYAIDALNGHYENITNTNLDGGFPYYTGTNAGINGNSPTSQYSDTDPSNIVFNLAKGILITSIETTSQSNAARCVFKGWNMQTTPPTNIWTSYCTPPQPESNVPLDPTFDISMVNNMTGASIFYPGPAYDQGGTIPGSAIVNLKTLSPSVLNSTLYNDWGYADQSPFCLAADGGASTGATSQGWGGSFVLDQNTGIAYVNTNNKGPYAGPCTAGPDLWADSILAINSTNGNWIWGFQTSAHDDWDWDCSWYQGLANETIGGVQTTVVNKTCKNGYMYQLNAANGSLIWAWTPPSSILNRCQFCYMQNPLNRTQMTNDWAAPNDENFISNPSELAGFESTASYDPVTNMIYVTSHNVPSEYIFVPLNASDYATSNGINSANPGAGFTDNATVEAVNAQNGHLAWSYNVPNIGFRGGMMSSGGVVYAPLVSGDVLLLNAVNGTLIKDLFIGAPMDVVPAIGATVSGQEEVFLEGGGKAFFGASTPGDLIALSLENVPLSTVSTATSVSTSTTTAISVSTATGSVSTATSTTTSVSTTTVSSGASSSTVYGLAAVAVIFIIATGYLAMRGRKPAS
jgi:outer membrane protein assembly factor BamB